MKPEPDREACSGRRETVESCHARPVRLLSLGSKASCFTVYAIALSVSAAEPDLSNLPPPASKTIQFTEEIKPILEHSCIQCHGPEKPKSRFRLDNRLSMLKGG